MELLHFSPTKCDLCGLCIKKCPFGALHMGDKTIEVDENCRMCSVCIKVCPQNAICFEQKAGSVDKSSWNDILVFAEQQSGKIHPITYELIGEAQKLAKKVNYSVSVVIIGGNGTLQNAQILSTYEVNTIYVYEHDDLSCFRSDCYTDVFSDCVSEVHPSIVLIGATALGRSLAPRVATRFHTGLTADCTTLGIKENTDLVQIRPAFGGNIMAQILITDSRPQFATVRYKVMEPAKPTEKSSAEIIIRKTTAEMVKSKIDVLEVIQNEISKQIEEENILVVAGRGVKDEKGLNMLKDLANRLGGQVCFTRPMVEKGIGDPTHQIGLSGRTVKPELIITCGVSGAIQFTSCMKNAKCIIAINSDPEAPIFSVANYCIIDDFYPVISSLLLELNSNEDGAK